MDTEFHHKRDEEFNSLLHLTHLRAFFIQNLRQLLLPQLRTIEQVSLGIGFEFGNINGDLMQFPDIIPLLLFQILIKRNTLSHQIIEPKIEDDLNKLTSQCLAFYDLFDAGGGHADLMLEFFELLLEFLDVVAFLSLVEDVVLVISQDFKQQGKDLILLFLDGPVAVD